MLDKYKKFYLFGAFYLRTAAIKRQLHVAVTKQKILSARQPDFQIIVRIKLDLIKTQLLISSIHRCFLF